MRTGLGISASLTALAMLMTVLLTLGRPVMGSEVDQDTAAPVQSFRQWLPAALAGDAAAQYELGHAYADGAVTMEDMAEAAHWYRQAANQGSIRAQRDLAILYNKGLGVPQDYVQAYVWFDLAAIRFGTGRRHDQAAEMRDMMAAFLTPEQLNDAKRRSEEWQAESE
ncbi:MAG: tetratricopeptide repeat protein [Alphaproteobacteria bacterium]